MNTLHMIKSFLVLAFIAGLSACGGGGGGGDVPATPTTQAVVSISLTGSDSSPAGSVQFDLTLPDGFTLAADVNNDLAAGVLTAEVAGSTVAASYLPETNLAYGSLSVAQITSDVNGLPAGVILTLTRTMAEGDVLPAATDFTISNLQISDGAYYLTGYNLTLAIEERTVN